MDYEHFLNTFKTTVDGHLRELVIAYFPFKHSFLLSNQAVILFDVDDFCKNGVDGAQPYKVNALRENDPTDNPFNLPPKLLDTPIDLRNTSDPVVQEILQIIHVHISL